ncbi:MAG: SLBB domain-containing protein [Treponema sp.]|nr:SLBB domain-containing protein [Treponema sp.]
MIAGKSEPKVYSFPRGGISFQDPFAPSPNSCVTAFLPSLSIIPLVQHSGERSYPVVSVGESVREGMLIGRGRGAGSANIHATVPGKVIRMASYRNSAGQTQDSFVIRMEGSFEKLGKREEIFPWEGMLPYDIQRTIADFGVVEMDGGGRPVSDMISSFRSAAQPITLVARCVFDDPWLAGDRVLCMERAKAIAEGAAITARTCRISRIVYAVSHNEKELGEAFLAAGSKWGIPCSVVLVGSRYPQRNRRELELVLRIYGKREGIELGSLFILGPATLAAVFDAVKLKKPILERYIAVGGSAVRHPQVMKARIGTRIGDLFAECGGFTGVPKKIAYGSPLLGRRLAYLDEPITKTTFAVFALLQGFRRESESSCISCGECRNICPVGLDPEELYKGLLSDSISAPRAKGKAGDAECHGCGCCEVACPSRLPLSTAIRSTVGESRLPSSGFAAGRGN